MKTKSIWMTLVAVLLASLLASCAGGQEALRKRAAVLCNYIPDHGLPEGAEQQMTADFYAALDTMFNHLPEFEAMDHEWLYYFVTGNGGTMADCTVKEVQRTDRTHAVATIEVRQKWEDGSFDETSDVEEHTLSMEKVDGTWLMSDFDGHKADCLRHIAISRREQAVRDAISDYLVHEIAPGYLQGELCIPMLLITAAEEDSEDKGRVWGDFWVFWYNIVGDTLTTMSGGSHPGCMTLEQKDGALAVTAFEQTTDGAGFAESAQRIFGKHYDVFESMHANDGVREAVRREQLREYVRRHNLAVHYCQDYGWPAVEL
ncbi:MAG: hypothetical protein J5814_09955 [Bacteroidaceae bacterium]|nr:hypothetical protein [Bacteroidaceae bacterium]